LGFGDEVVIGGSLWGVAKGHIVTASNSNSRSSSRSTDDDNDDIVAITEACSEVIDASLVQSLMKLLSTTFDVKKEVRCHVQPVYNIKHYQINPFQATGFSFL